MKARMGGDYNIRNARPNDWDQISRISEEISVEGLVGDYISRIGQKYLTRGQTYVIEQGDEVVGYHNIQDVPDGSVYLSGLRIAKQHRKKGLALWLIQETLSPFISSGKRVARAYIEPENYASRSLFERAGFSKSHKMHLYFGSLETGDFLPEENWPDSVIDIGHVPSRRFQGIPAKILRKGKCIVSRSEPGVWDGLPSFTVLNPESCRFEAGPSFIVSLEKLGSEQSRGLEVIDGFNSAFLYEKDLSGTELPS